jgi:hypothetical protein
MAKLQPMSWMPPMSFTMAAMMVLIMVSTPACRKMPRLMMQKVNRRPERQRADQATP